MTIVGSATVLLVTRLAEASDIQENGHAVGVFVGASPLYARQPDDNSERAAYAAGGLEYRYRWTFVTAGGALAVQPNSLAVYPALGLSLPLSALELNVSFGFGIARLWGGQQASGFGRHAEGSVGCMFRIQPQFDLGIEISAVAEKHPRVDRADLGTFAAPLRVVARYRF